MFCKLFNFISRNSAFIISILALLFSILSFWWIHWRRGKLIVSYPTKFGLISNKKLIIQLPLVFYNSGAATIIVNNLRVLVSDKNNQNQFLHFNNTFDDLESNSGRQLGYAFPVVGRKTYERVFVFMKSEIEFQIPDGEISYVLEGQINNKQKWKKLLSGVLKTPSIHHKTMHEILRGYNNY